MNAALALATVPLGPVLIVVSGGVVSIVNVSVAGVASCRPAASIARTRKVCAPGGQRRSVYGEVQAVYAGGVELALERRAGLVGA